MAVVLTPRSVGLMVVAALASGWLGASMSQGPVPAQAARGGDVIRPIGSSAAMPRAENLRQRLAEPPPPDRGRNPFVFASRARARSTGYRDRPDPTAEVAPVPSAPPVPPIPVFRLSGVASNTEAGVTMLTAILNDNGSMVFAKAGDKLSNGYSVVRVDEMSVTLVDATGVTQTIRLP